ncbi:unnamed protein product [Brassica rapa subsp. trilocularis]
MYSWSFVTTMVEELYRFTGITVMVKPGSWEALKVDLLSSRVSREQCDIGVSSCYLAVDGVSGVLTMVLIRFLP